MVLTKYPLTIHTALQIQCNNGFIRIRCRTCDNPVFFIYRQPEHRAVQTEAPNRISLQVENIQVLSSVKPFFTGFVLAIFFLESNTVECDIYMLIRDLHIIIPLNAFRKRLAALRRECRFSTGAVEDERFRHVRLADSPHRPPSV